MTALWKRRSVLLHGSGAVLGAVALGVGQTVPTDSMSKQGGAPVGDPAADALEERFLDAAGVRLEYAEAVPSWQDLLPVGWTMPVRSSVQEETGTVTRWSPGAGKAEAFFAWCALIISASRTALEGGHESDARELLDRIRDAFAAKSTQSFLDDPAGSFISDVLLPARTSLDLRPLERVLGSTV